MPYVYLTCSVNFGNIALKSPSYQAYRYVSSTSLDLTSTPWPDQSSITTYVILDRLFRTTTVCFSSAVDIVLRKPLPSASRRHPYGIEPVRVHMVSPIRGVSESQWMH